MVESPSPTPRPDPIVVREFAQVGKHRVRVVRSSISPRASVILDVREYVGGPDTSFEGFTRHGIRLTSLAEVRILREALDAIESEKLLKE